MARNVFVSYSQPDRDSAFAIVQRLEARGVSVWIAPRDVAPAADWAAAIIEAISAAQLMLLVFSGASNDSPQVRREVERAVHKQLPVLPFRLENVLPSSSLEYFLSSQHWMDAFPQPLEQHVDRLCDYLEATLGDSFAHDVPAASTRTFRADMTGFRATPVAADPAQLLLLEAELARWIGPVAGHLLRHAARAGGDLDAIAQRLATEIDGDPQRRAFLRACWQIGHCSG